MSKQEIASLAVKIIAIYIFVNAIVSASLETLPYVQQQFYAATQGVRPDFSLGSIQNMFVNQLFSLLFPAVIAVILWRISDWLGKKMVHDTKEKHTKQSVNALELQTILISVIGLFVCINAIPGFIGFFTVLSMPSIPGLNFNAVLLQLINPLLSVLMGGILLFNAARISRYLQRAL